MPTSGLTLPLPFTPPATLSLYRTRLLTFATSLNTRTILAFWLLGLLNNILYVILLSAAQDLVGSSIPKGIVLLADVLPSFATKLIAPYFIHRVPYSLRILCLIALSTLGMLLVATTPTHASLAAKLAGVVLASLSSGAGELSFLGLTHFYGAGALAAWGSGTGAAGLAGAGMYVLLTETMGLPVRTALLMAAALPVGMAVSFFGILPREALRGGVPAYRAVGTEEDVYVNGGEEDAEGLPGEERRGLVTGPTAYKGGAPTFAKNLARARALVVPYMLPLLLVYVAEYSINQGVAPVLLFPVEDSPFKEFREFYPFYGFLYQLGVFISRSSTPWIRLKKLYPPSLLQVGNLGVLTAQALFFFIPSVYLIFVITFWEGLLGGAVYVNTFAAILEEVDESEREFSLGATSVSDSAGICIAGALGIVLETKLCEWQVGRGRDWCRNIKVEGV